MNLRQLHQYNQRGQFRPRIKPEQSMNRYAVDHSRGRIVLRATSPELAVERAQALTPGATGHYAVALPSFNPATPVATTPSTMKSETKKAAKASPKKTLGDRVEKTATKKAPKPKVVIEPRHLERTAKPKAGMSGLDAAADVLSRSKEPLNAKQILACIQSDGLAPGLQGKTPHATLYSGMITEIAKKGKESRFARGDEKGTFIFAGRE